MAWTFEIADLVIDTANWTAVVTPFACNSVVVKNALQETVRVRTDEAEDTLTAGAQEVVMAQFVAEMAPEGYCRRFKAGATVMFLKATIAGGAVKVRFLY